MKQNILFLLVIISFSSFSEISNWEDSPNNWENSENNWENSELNYENSPMNWDNNPMNLSSERIIRAPEGNATGYIVPKENGGANIFDLEGNREGYLSK